VITLRPGNLPDAVDQAEEILLGHAERFMIFQRATELVRAFSLAQPRKGGGLHRPRGTLQLEPLGGVALTEIFDRITQWQQLGAKGRQRIIDCPPRIAAAYLSRTASWRLPVLAGIISAPILREDGTVLTLRGYDQSTGLFLDSDEDWPAVPDQPTCADAETALRTLRAPFAEFPFVANEDLSVHIAAIVTAVQRRLLGACPIFAYSAPAPRSGKSLLAESVAIIAIGKPAPATAFSGEREEIRKAIMSALREGHSIINLDNIEVPLSSPDLARAITQSEYQDRLLGESRMLRLPTSVLWTATGNNLVFRGDLSSRALLCRIDSRLESPESREFTIPRLADFLKSNRHELVIAALTILRAYQVAGCPRQNLPPWGGFDDWSGNIREALVWVGLSDPCKTRAVVLGDDLENEEALAGIRALYDGFGIDEFRVKEIIDRCAFDDALKSSIQSFASGRQHRHEIDSRRLGWWLRRIQNRILGGLRLHLSRRTAGIAYWRIEEVSGTGYRGFGGHFPVAGNASQPANDSSSTRQPENNPSDPCDHQNSDDVGEPGSGRHNHFDGPSSDDEVII
jgi:putative DNA primase/helicase